MRVVTEREDTQTTSVSIRVQDTVHMLSAVLPLGGK